MAAGKYRERAVFTRLNNEAVDAYGQPHNAWDALTTVWSDLRETPGRERVEAGAVNSAVTGTLRIRYSTTAAGITAADRVAVRGNTWNIRSVSQPDRKSKQIEMLIERGVSP
jgi:SPP1 family predicted phage head-tail adaptor